MKAKQNAAPQIDIGISAKDRKEIADGLARLLADTYTLYLKTHNFHWNVTGPMFNTLHLSSSAVQRARSGRGPDRGAHPALGVQAPGSYREFAKLTKIEESEGSPTANEMIMQLVEGQETVVRTARSVFPDADAAHDEPTADLLTGACR
jgi:starvation-inducible DNA-binding protein